MAYDNSVPYSFIKRGIYYFERRVPRDLKKHYDTSKISYSLRTKSAAVAASRARQAAEQLDQYWYHLRILNSELPGKHRLRIRQGAPASVSPDTNVPDVTLSEAVEVYLRLKGSGRPITFHRAAERSCGYVIDTCGDKHLSEYTRTDANAFRDMLINRGMAGSSITRVFGTVRAVFNFTSSELGLTMPNPFSGVYYDRSLGVKDRQPLSIDEIRVVQKECRKTNDDLRWLVALVSDTGMRLQAHAMNMAAAIAIERGAEFLVRADLHARYPRDFISKLCATARKTNANSVVVSMRTQGGNRVQNAARFLFSTWLGNGGSPHRIEGFRGWVAHGHHALFRVEDFIRVGGYDPEFAANEDAEFDLRLVRADGRIFLESDAAIDYFPRQTLKGSFKQFFRNGRYRVWTAVKHRERLGNLFRLTDEQMAGLRQFFPRSHGKSLVNDRRGLGAIVLFYRNGLRWSDALGEYGPTKTLCPERGQVARRNGRLQRHPKPGSIFLIGGSSQQRLAELNTVFSRLGCQLNSGK